MSLTLPTQYSNASKGGNVSENWIVQLYHQDSFLSFDGTNDFVDLGATTSAHALALTGATNATIAFWIKFPTLGSTEFIFANNSATNYAGFVIYKDSDNKISILQGNNSGTGGGNRRTMLGSTALSANTWYFISITTDFANDSTSGTNIKINNSAETTATSGSLNQTLEAGDYTTGNAYIGRRHNSYGEFDIKTLSVWSGVLTDASLTSLYNSGKILSTSNNYNNYTESSNLVGNYALNNGENVIVDSTSNALTGALSGSKYVDFLGLSLKNTVVDSVFYHGVIANKPSLRNSIDLVNSKAQTGGIGLTVANFIYNNDNFSAELYGDRIYLNKTAKVFSQLNNNSSISECVQIYHGYLSQITHDNNNISLNLEEKTPWKFISVPKTKHPIHNIYEPIVYGAFTPADISTFASIDGAYGTVFPVKVIKTSTNVFETLMPRSYSSNAYVHACVSNKFYLPLIEVTDSGTQKSSTTTVEHGLNVLSTPTRNYGAGFFVPEKSSYVPLDSVNFFNNRDNAFIIPDDFTSLGLFDTSTYAYFPVTSQGSPVFFATTTVTENFKAVLVSSVKIRHGIYPNDTSHTQDQLYDFKFWASIATNDYDLLELNNGTIDSITGTGSTGDNVAQATGTNDDFVFNRTPANNYKVDGSTVANSLLAPDELFFKYVPDSDGGSYLHTDHELRIFGIKLFARVYYSDESFPSGDKANLQDLEDVKTFYCGGDGLTSFNKWKTADSGLIIYGHEAHRDLISRFTNQNLETPVNWDALNTDRSTNNWKIRHWQHTPVKLEDYLNTLSKEFGFIFKYNPSGRGSYIYIKQTSELSSVFTISKNDIENLSISKNFNEVLTQITYNNVVNAKDDTYLVTRTGD